MKGVFKKHLIQAFNEAHKKSPNEPIIEDFLNYLLEHHIINTLTIRRYTIIKEFEKQYPKHSGHKTQTVYTIANRFNLSSRTVWTVLKDHLTRFNKTD